MNDTMTPSAHSRPRFITTAQMPIWVVITGNVRSGREFREIFKQATELRTRGLIDGIRFVTWKGELEQAPGLEQALTHAGVSILVVDPPAPFPKIHPLFHGYVYHQRKALHFALKSLPENVYVLKARTDFAGERFESMVATLFGVPNPEMMVDIPEPILQTRLFTYDIRPDYFFYWDDIVFSGVRDDLLKLNNFDLACDVIYPTHTSCAETRLFSPLFLNHYPILKWFFENIDGECFSRFLQACLGSATRQPLPTLAQNILASYFHVLSRYVILPRAENPAAVEIGLNSFFIPGGDLGVIGFPTPWPSHKLVSQCLVDRLSGKEEFLDPNLASVALLMRRMDSDVQARGAISPEFQADLDSLMKFAEQYGIDFFRTQVHLIPSVSSAGLSHNNSLENVRLPEKRYLSRWQQKVLGFRKRLTGWILKRIL